MAVLCAVCCVLSRFSVNVDVISVLQGLATMVAAVGSGVLLAGFMTGHVDGAGTD